MCHYLCGKSGHNTLSSAVLLNLIHVHFNSHKGDSGYTRQKLHLEPHSCTAPCTLHVRYANLSTAHLSLFHLKGANMVLCQHFQAVTVEGPMYVPLPCYLGSWDILTNYTAFRNSDAIGLNQHHKQAKIEGEGGA